MKIKSSLISHLIKNIYKKIGYCCRFFVKRKEIVLIPVLTSFDDLIDQLYRLTWFIPVRDNVTIRIYFCGFKVDDKDLFNESNRPWYMHSLQLNIEGIKFTEYNNKFISKMYIFSKTLFMSIFLICREWDKESFFYKIIKLSGNLLIIDHTSCSYSSDVNSVKIISKIFYSNEKKMILEKSKNIFYKTAELAKRKYNKVYIFGRGPSLNKAFKMDFSDGSRIVCNQIVCNRELMEHIKPHVVIGGDHYWNFGCSKLADYFRHDAVDWILNNEAILVVPFDCYPLMITHYPELEDKMVGIPLAGVKQNYDLMENFSSKGSLGVLFEFLFPIASTFSKNIMMLGFDGNSNKVDLKKNKIAFTHFKLAEYPSEIVETIHGARPGYYDRDLSDFRNNFDKQFITLIKDAEDKGFNIETLAPSYHTALKNRYKN